MRNVQQPYTDRARRRLREIALAIVLTLAAALFLVAALQRQVGETAAMADRTVLEERTTN